jgi:hypothetical protein
MLRLVNNKKKKVEPQNCGIYSMESITGKKIVI